TPRIACSRAPLIEVSTRSRTIVSTSRPTYPTSVNFVASTLMNGASASRARRRAISVLPTPVGPIIRMFFGVISWRSGSATCWRRQRFRIAIATARFARSCPTMCLSSSWTISCGVMLLIGSLQHFDRALLVRRAADVGGNRERALDDIARGKLGAAEQRQRCRLRIRSAGSDRDDALLRREHVADAGDQQRVVPGRD